MLAPALVLALAACGGGEESAPTTSAEAPSAAFAAAGCPVDDPAACERAALAATALEEGDIAALVEVSYADTFVCDDLPAEMFRDCSPGETLEGHAVTGSGRQDRDSLHGGLRGTAGRARRSHVRRRRDLRT